MERISALCFILLLFGCNNSQPQNAKQIDPPQATHVVSFNTSDKYIEKNGNLVVAINKVLSESKDDLSRNAEPSTPESITTSPYSYIGKVVSIRGKVYKIEELPPSNNLKGHWIEMLMAAPNPNSALGESTIDFICYNPPEKIKSGHIITCTGYFIGTFNSPNAVGGSIEVLSLVGNNWKR